MEQETTDAAADTAKPQPQSRLVSIVSILRKVAELSQGELTVSELADALTSSAFNVYDADTMMLYPRMSSGLAEPINSQYRPDKVTGYNWRMDIICEIYNSGFWNNPDATILARPYGRIDVHDLLVLKDDGVEIARRLWRLFYPNQEMTIDESVIAEGRDTKRSEANPGCSTPRPAEGKAAKRSGEKTSYSTPHLVILNDAIAEFFEPRRERDAKKEEVVGWIKSKMTAFGMTDSENIAQAIFTIIKPVDHDPKKRRG